MGAYGENAMKSWSRGVGQQTAFKDMENQTLEHFASQASEWSVGIDSAAWHDALCARAELQKRRDSGAALEGQG